jgi:hypothetical protein
MGRGMLVLVYTFFRSWEIRTWSDSVAQCALSISVATRPGASGVPLWSSLYTTRQL